MKVTVIGAGNSGLAMAAHLSMGGNKVSLWNRSKSNIATLMKSKTIYCQGVIRGKAEIYMVTDQIQEAVQDPDLILITTPASSHQELAKLLAQHLKKETLIVLNPGRTLGALEFQRTYQKWNKNLNQRIAESQTIIHTCRKTADDCVEILSLKPNVLISTFRAEENNDIILSLPKCIRQYFIPAQSMIETSIGNVGMILHCAPLLLNTGWTESKDVVYKYYYDGITPSIGRLIEGIDQERVLVSKLLGLEVETTKAWLKRTYRIRGSTLYQCIQNNQAYKTIDAPSSLDHRYIFEDIPCGLVPLEAIGTKLGIKMKGTSLIIDLASTLMEVDFRRTGRHLKEIGGEELKSLLEVLPTRRAE